MEWWLVQSVLVQPIRYTLEGHLPYARVAYRLHTSNLNEYIVRLA